MKKVEPKLQCLNCRGTKFNLEKKRITTEFKSEKFDVLVPVHVCDKCKFELADTNQMNVLRTAAADAYRAKHGLLQSTEIIKFREQLGMSQREFAVYLNVGEASIKRWETYNVQDDSQDDHIRLKCSLKSAEENLSELNQKLVRSDEYSGGAKYDQSRIDNLMLALLETCKTPLFANKGAFYADFAHHQKFGKSITGSPYEKLDYGPCPKDQKLIFQRLQAKGWVKASGNGHDLEVKRKADFSLFSDTEKNILKKIVDLTRTKSGRERMLSMSHEEDAYLKAKFYSFVSYSYSKKLKLRIG